MSKLFDLVDGLEAVLYDLQRSQRVFAVAKRIRLDGEDEEDFDALQAVFEERFESELQRLEEVYNALFKCSKGNSK